METQIIQEIDIHNDSFNSGSHSLDNTETKHSTSIMNASHDTLHSIEEVNVILEEYHAIKIKDHEFLSTSEQNEDIARLEVISDKLLAFTTEDPGLVTYINEADNLKDMKKYYNQKENKTFATYNKYTDKEPEVDSSGSYLMSRTFLNKLLCENTNLYYRTHELNDILYLHFKGFRKLDNLNTFINLRVLYLESNCIKKIENLDSLQSLTCLYLQENMIEKIENLEKLRNLNTLNLSDNCIKKIENLSENKKLNSLLIKRNKIGQEEGDLDGLLNMSPTVSVVDISDNKISNERIIDDYLIKMEGLRVLYLFGNDCCRKISHYRKTLTYKLKELRYIDDKPIFEDERRFSEAYGRGGLEEERKDRELYRKEKKDESIQRIHDFQEMIEGWKKKNPAIVKISPLNEEEKINEHDQIVDIIDNVNKNDNDIKKKEMLNRMNQRLQNTKNLNNSSSSKTTLITEVKNDIEEKSKDINENNDKYSINHQNTGIKLDIIEDVIDELEEEVVTTKMPNITDRSINVENNKIYDDLEDLKMPSLEQIKAKRDDGWLEREWKEAKKINNLGNENVEDTQKLSSSIIDIREKEIKNTHISNSIFDELD